MKKSQGNSSDQVPDPSPAHPPTLPVRKPSPNATPVLRGASGPPPPWLRSAATVPCSRPRCCHGPLPAPPGPRPRGPAGRGDPALTVECRRLQRGPRGTVNDFDGAASGHRQDGVERRVVAQTTETVGVAAQAAVPQQQPLAGARPGRHWPGPGPRPIRRRRRRAGGRRSHLPGRCRHRPQDKRPRGSRSLTVPRAAAAASHHPGPGRGGKGERQREQEVTPTRRMRNRPPARQRTGLGGGGGASSGWSRGGGARPGARILIVASPAPIVLRAAAGEARAEGTRVPGGRRRRAHARGGRARPVPAEPRRSSAPCGSSARVAAASGASAGPPRRQCRAPPEAGGRRFLSQGGALLRCEESA